MRSAENQMLDVCTVKCIRPRLSNKVPIVQTEQEWAAQTQAQANSEVISGERLLTFLDISMRLLTNTAEPDPWHLPQV